MASPILESPRAKSLIFLATYGSPFIRILILTFPVGQSTHLIRVLIFQTFRQTFRSARKVLIKSCRFNELLILISLNHFPHNGYYPAAD